MLRPARASSMRRRRYSGAYGGCVRGMGNLLFYFSPIPSTKAGQLQRCHIHYTPTYASWLNQVERWFGLITQQAIRRGSFRSVGELVQKIDAYVTNYNLHRRPFVWTATADSR